MVRYRKYKFICNFKTHHLKDSKENIQKVTISPSTHTSLIFETIKSKILKKKIENIKSYSKYTEKQKSRV